MLELFYAVNVDLAMPAALPARDAHTRFSATTTSWRLPERGVPSEHSTCALDIFIQAAISVVDDWSTARWGFSTIAFSKFPKPVSKRRAGIRNFQHRLILP